MGLYGGTGGGVHAVDAMPATKIIIITWHGMSTEIVSVVSRRQWSPSAVPDPGILCFRFFSDNSNGSTGS